jgi:hypothetical protein
MPHTLARPASNLIAAIVVSALVLAATALVGTAPALAAPSATKSRSHTAGACRGRTSQARATRNTSRSRGTRARACARPRRGARHLVQARASRRSRSVAAPVLSAQAETLSWTSVYSGTNYVLATIRHPTTTRDTTYSVVSGTSFKAPAVSGETVKYAVRADADGAAWSNEVSITYAAPTPPPPPPSATPSVAAPVLSAQAETLSWTSVYRGTNYVLATIRHPTTTRDTTYSVVSGTSFKAPAVSGETVKYAVRADADGAAWSNEVSITYAAAPAPPANSSLVKGMVTNALGWGTQGPAVMNETASIGASWLREDLAWRTVMPDRVTHDWSAFDGLLSTAKSNNKTILPLLGSLPSWTTADDTAGYADFVKQAVQRYGPGTSANLTWFELWNEPYYDSAGLQSDPDRYAKLVKAAVTAARQVNPNVKFLVAAEMDYDVNPAGHGPYQGRFMWTDEMFQSVPDLGSYIDAISVHPYGNVDPSTAVAANRMSFQRIDSIRQTFLNHGVDRPEWITEIGWSTWDVSEQQQADYYTHMFNEVHSRLSFVRAVFPFCLREFSGTPTNDQPQFGLERYGSWAHKPAWQSVQTGFAGL